MRRRMHSPSEDITERHDNRDGCDGDFGGKIVSQGEMDRRAVRGRVMPFARKKARFEESSRCERIITGNRVGTSVSYQSSSPELAAWKLS